VVAEGAAGATNAVVAAVVAAEELVDQGQFQIVKTAGVSGVANATIVVFTISTA
jgi:hypothetical protein